MSDFKNSYNNYQSKNYGSNSDNGYGKKPAFQKKVYTPEELKNISLPVSVVITGNDQVPDQVALAINRVVKALQIKNVVIRTGGLDGTDAVVYSANRDSELHLPFKGYNKLESASQYTSEPCLEIAKRFKEDLESLPNVPKATYAKNPRLVFGRYLTAPAQLVIIWSQDACEEPREVTSKSGIAGHVLKIAAASGIRVINLQKEDGEARVYNFLESIYVKESGHPEHRSKGTEARDPGTDYTASFSY